MTIQEYVANSKKQSINDWLLQIKTDGYDAHRNIILDCAEFHDKITVSNLSINDMLIKSINI